jgi:DNA-binding NarL/FixJ family response regulator
MNGIQVLEKLKSDDKTKPIPVIMLTNLAGQQDAEAALAKGAVKYIIKSEHDPKEVVDMVKEIIAGYTRNEIPQAAPSGPAPAPTADPAQPASPAPEPDAPAEPAAPPSQPPEPPASSS